jgi:hypothetical protein
MGVDTNANTTMRQGDDGVLRAENDSKRRIIIGQEALTTIFFFILPAVDNYKTMLGTVCLII